MPKEEGQFKKGNPGKQPGTENKTTRDAKQLFLTIMEGEVDHIEKALETLREKNPDVYLTCLSKLFPYFMPKKLQVDIPTELTVNVKRRN